MTACQHHKDKGTIHPSLTEQMVLNYDALPGGMRGWRCFRIEYGFECSCPEGLIYLPPHRAMEVVDHIEALLNEAASSPLKEE